MDNDERQTARTAGDEEQPPPRMACYYIGLLTRGRNWTAEETPETIRIGEGHMANIRRLGEAGTLIIAGPCPDDSPLQGIYIFKVPSLAEAQALADSDPAVQAGRLVFEIHPWWVMKGLLP
jgi:uncharacterized protein YciI